MNKQETIEQAIKNFQPKFLQGFGNQTNFKENKFNVRYINSH